MDILNLRSQCGNFVSRPFFAGTFRDFCVDSALESAVNLKDIPGAALGHFQGGSSPENAGQIIRSVEGSGDSQHYIADFPTEGSSAIHRIFAQRPFQNDLVDRFAILADNAGRKDKNQQMPHTVGADVVGPDLTGYRDHFAATGIKSIHQRCFRNHRQQIHRAG